MNIDHVTIAGASLDALRKTFDTLGFPTDYGGPHSNGITHMALLGFDDGSYIELISTLKPGQESPWWDRYIKEDAGPCAWAIRADDIDAEAKRIAKQGVAVRGPDAMHRDRPDGKRVEWDLATLGEGDPGVKLPFLIHDRTPRSLRVEPSPSVAHSELTGIAHVVITAQDLHESDRIYSRLFGGWESPRGVDEHLPAELQTFDNLPVIFASPLDPRTPLAARHEKYGTCPLAYLIKSTDLGRSARRFPNAYEGLWFENPVLWLPSAGDLPWLGIVDW